MMLFMGENMDEDKIKKVRDSIRVIEGYPVAGISFKDITTLIHDGQLFSDTIDAIIEMIRDVEFDYFIGPEARGFIFGAPLATRMKKGFIPVRKKGKLPYETASYKYSLEYGEDEVFVHRDSIRPGDRVMIVDDLLATGGTAGAVAELVRMLGGEVVGFASLIELDDLKGREKLGDCAVYSLIHYDH